MFEQKLYLAVPQTSELKQALKSTNPHLIKILQLTEIEGNFLGKETPLFPTLEHLTNLESHVLSLIRRIAPNCKAQVQLVTSLI